MKYRMLALIAAFFVACMPALAARTALTPQSLPYIYGSIAAGAATLSFTAANVTDKNEYITTGRELIIARNVGASPYTVTVSSAPDKLGRTKDITAYSIAANSVMMLGPVPLDGFKQTGGKVYLEASNASIEFAIVRLK